MLLTKYFSFSILHFLLLLLVVSATLFLGIGKASAASTQWTYDQEACDDIQSSITNGEVFLWAGAWIPLTSYPVPPGYTLRNNGGSYEICKVDVIATFYASSNKDTYNPGEAVEISVAARSGGGGGSSGPLWNPFSDPIISFISCLLGCSSPPIVGVDARWEEGGQVRQVAQCDAENGCSKTVPNAFTAPTTPGVYTVNTVGCYQGCSGSSAGSSFTIKVEAPVVGECGAANGVPSVYRPSSGLCDSGTASAVDNPASTPWQWTWECTPHSASTPPSGWCFAPKTICPAEIIYTDSNQGTISSYCQATQNLRCVAGYKYANLTCHSGTNTSGQAIWSSYGSSCTAPYCTGCDCVKNTTPTVILWFSR